LAFADPRQEHGDLLWRERFGATEIESLKRSLGSYAAAGQLQQRPSPAGGGLLRRHWFRFWQPQGANLPPVPVRLPDGSHQSIAALELVRIDELIQSWDCAFKDLETSDFVVGQVWGRTGANFILLDQTRESRSPSFREVAAVPRQAHRGQGQRISSHPNARARDPRHPAGQSGGR